MEGKYRQVTEVLKLFERSDLTTMYVEFDGVRLNVSKDDEVLTQAAWQEPHGSQVARAHEDIALRKRVLLPAAAASEAAAPTAESEPDVPEGEGLRVVRAPMLGTLYRSPSPGEPPFVEEGSEVKVDQTLCLIECMKLFNTIPAGVEGRLVRFAVANGALVEFDQPIAYVQT